MPLTQITPRKIFILVGASIGAILLLFSAGSLVETNTAGNVQVKQAAITGELTCKLDPGMWAQMFGTIHTYKEASTFHFSATSERGDGSLPTRFADATKAQVSGTVRVLLPVTDCDSLIQIHKKFRSFDGVMVKLVEPAMKKALFNSGPHMTAAESYAERRGEFASLAEDQLMNGVIRVDQVSRTVVDILTGKKTVIRVVQPRSCTEENDTCIGGFARQIGVFRAFGITLTNFVIDGITYPDNVLAQIEAQRAARMDIITQQAEAQQAEARAKKAVAEASAAVAETRAKEEISKTQRIVKAEADKAEAILHAQKVKEVAKLAKDAAVFEKDRQILLGQGEATRKRLVMGADGALDKKLAAYVATQKAWAEAYSKRKVPTTVFGGSGSGGQDGSTQVLIDLLTAKTAKDLSLDISTK